MVESLDQSCAGEGLCHSLGIRLPSQSFRGYAVGIGHIDDGLALPAGKGLCNIRVGLETHG
jgi:hypothetical protein